VNGVMFATVFIMRRTRTSGHEWADPYEDAILRVKKYIKLAHDGTLVLDVKSGDQLGIDPVLFADLKRSLDETNQKIRRGEISSQGIFESAP